MTSGNTSLISLDGSHGEGGGALLRAALSMSVLTQQPVQLNHIRGGTPFHGLDVEDITLVKVLQKVCNADVTGLEIGSHSLIFAPKKSIRAFNGSIETERNHVGRGSNSLVLATTLIPLLARAGAYSEIEIEGETHSNNSMTYDYLVEVILPIWRKMNLYVEPELIRAAYARDKVGTVKFAVEPTVFHGVRMVDRGQPKQLRASITASKLGSGILARSISHLQRLAQTCKMKIDIQTANIEADSPGIYICVAMQYEHGIGGAGEMGARSIRAEQVAQVAFEKCLDWMTGEAALDPIVAEHLLIPGCFSDSSSEFKVSCLTARFQTIVWVIKQFLPIRIVIRGVQGGPGHVSINQ
jgi:RNA 3'-terminal phosphate cyclase (ATP)